LSVVGAAAGAASGQTPFAHQGIDGQHPPSSVLPNEQVDPASGTLAVVATDLVLPGNAGFNLSVTRVYNSTVYPNYSSGGSTAFDEDSWAGIGWKLHFGRVINPDATASGATQIEMGDGSRHALYQKTGGGWITGDFWLYDRPTATLQLPNGLVYVFGRSVFINSTVGTVRYVTEIRDPFQNRLTVHYFDASGPPDGIADIQQDLGNLQVRTVTFTYDAILKALASMTYNGHTWTYQHLAAGPSGYSVLTGVTPPIGPGWRYEYSGPLTGELTKLTTPSGGWLTYGYADATRRAGSLSELHRVVATRATGGPGITAGTWTYSYGTGANQDTTVVTCSCGTTRYRFYGTGATGDFTGWSAGTLAEQTIEDNGTVLERQTMAWARSEPISPDPVPGVGGVWADDAVYRPLLNQQVITRGTHSWTITNAYNTGLGNYNDYARPSSTKEEESVYRWRLTTRTFQYGFTPYIVKRTASESVSIKTAFDQGAGPQSRSWAYNTATGFLTAQTLFGFSTTFEASAQGNVAASTDGRSNRTTYAYAWGALQDVRTPRTQVTYGINSDGLVTSADNHRDSVITYSYDQGFRPLLASRPLLNPAFNEYDTVNALWVRTGRDQAQAQSQLDGFGRVVSTVNRYNVKTRVERDACGRTTFASEPYTTAAGTRGTTTQYDVLGRVVRTTDPAGAQTQFLYDGVSVTRTDAASRTTLFDYSAFGGPGTERLMSVRDPTNVTTAYEYDLFGNLTKVTGPVAGVTRVWTRDGRGLPQSDTQPESGTTSYLYDAVGHVTQHTDANGAITLYTYDTDNRLTLRTTRPGTVDDLTITYDDLVSRVTSLSGGGAITNYAYDINGLLAQRQDIANGLTFTSTYRYDNNDYLTTLTYPSGRIISYVPDSENRLTAVKQNGIFFAQGITYDDSSRLASYITGAVTHTVTYDLADRPARLLSSSVGGALDLTYTYDAVGNVRTIADPRLGAQQDFTVDPLDRLATADGPWGHLGWTYDAGGNRLSQAGTDATSYTYTTATQRLTSSSGTASETFAYDNVGQLTSDSFGQYGYTPLGRLATAARAGVSASYAYDAAGGRLTRTVNGQTTYAVRSGSGGVLTEYAAPCSGSLVWSRDYIYAGARLVGAIKSAGATPTVSVVASALSVGEAAGAVNVSFALATPGGAPLSCAVTALYHTTGGTATSGADFTARSGSVLFPAGSPSGATQTIAVPIIDDLLNEDDETFFVDLVSATGASLGTYSRTTVTIIDNDPLPTLSVSDASVIEGNSGYSTLTFIVSLNTPSGRIVRVNYASTPNTATAGTTAAPGVDYLSVSGTLTFAPGVVSQTVAVLVVGDLIPEPDESLFLDLSSPTNATLARARGRGVILNDDPWVTQPARDFNADGWADLVFRHRVSGSNALWYMTGNTLVSTTAFLPTGPGGADVLADMNWEIRAVGDFNNDGKPDLLWQNASTGQLSVWLFNNQTRTATVSLSLLSGGMGEPDLNWKVVGAADMNGDGLLDLVWSNRQTGALRLWHLDGLVQLDSVPLAAAATDLLWEVVGVADMNGDGRPDLVWRHYGTGGMAAWMMQDALILSTPWLSPDINSDVNWRIVGVIDMNGDGKADLVWQHAVNGQLAVWYMNGTTMTSTNYLQPSSVTDTNWRIVGIR
jgi:YD repeat-containing protein